MSLSDQWSPTSAQVTVLQARGLRIKGKNGTNDAYAVMHLGKDKYQTSVAEKSVAPVWKEEASFDMPQQQQQGGTERGTLHVQVLHRALVGPDKLLGQAVINLLQLRDDKNRDKTQWFKLLDKTGKSDKDRGEVLVDIVFTRNNMTASMFDISATGKSRSRLGKFKDKVRGKKKEDGFSETSSNIVPASEDEEDSAGEGAAVEKGQKKKSKVKSLFSHKTNLQKSHSQSMSVLPGKNSSLSGSMSSGLNVEASEGKKKFKFLSHKRTASSDKKEQKLAAEQSNLCINGSHIYCDEPAPRTSRTSSNFSLASSGVGSMDDVPDSSPPSMGSRRSVRHSSPWTEEEEEETIKENTQQEDDANLRREELEKLAEEERRAEEEERNAAKMKKAEEERRRVEEETRRIERERLQREEEEERAAEILRAEEERKRQEEEERLEEERRLEAEEQRRRELEEEERIRLESEQKRQEEERRRQEEEEEMRLEVERNELERRRRREEERLMEEERKRREEEERLEEERREIEERERVREEEEERIRLENEQKRREEERQRQEEEMRLEAERKAMERRREEERLLEEERKRQEEEERLEEERRDREEKERIRQEKERIMLENEQKRQEEERLEEERRELEEKERIRQEKERIRLENEQKRQEEERERQRQEEEMRLEAERQALERRLEEEREELRKQRLLEEEKRRKEEEERREEEMKREEERKRLEEEEEQKRLEEKKRQEEQQQEQERIRQEEEKMRLEKIKAEEELERKRKEEEEERRKREEALEKEREEERRRAEKGRAAVEEAQRRGKVAPDARKRINVPSTISTNPFDESDEENVAESSGRVTSARQRCKLPVESNTSSLNDVNTSREKRQAPKPPRMNSSERLQAARQEVNPQSKDKEIKTASVLPQPSVQKIHVASSSSQIKSNQTEHFPRTERSSGRRPAPQRPSLTETENISHKNPLPTSKQTPTVSNLNPFEDDEDVDELADTTAPVSLVQPPLVQERAEKDAVSPTKLKSSKAAHAPAPPANTALDRDAIQEGTISEIVGKTDPAPVQQTSPTESQAVTEEAVHNVPPVAPLRRLLPVKPLNSQDDQQDSSVQDTRETKITGEINNGEKENIKNTGPYALLTQEELISLVVKQESQLLEKGKKISELEQYIDNLLVRVIEEAPSVLMTIAPLK